MKSFIRNLIGVFALALMSTSSCAFQFDDWRNSMTDVNDSIVSAPYFYKHQDYVTFTNLQTDNSFKLEMNKFAAYENSDFKSLYQGMYTPKETPKIKNVPEFPSIAPSTVDWRNTKIVGAIKDQAQCGSCWAFSAINALEGQVSKLLGKTVSLSEEEMVDCVKNVKSPDGTQTCCDGCEGGEMYSVYQYLNNKEDDTQTQYPYTAKDGTCNQKPSVLSSVAVKDYVSLPSKDEETLMKAVSTQGPISVGVDANLDWQLYHSGIYDPSHSLLGCSPNINKQDHGVAIVGYGADSGKDYWIIRNSWGKSWGENGYMRLVRGENACGVANSPIYPIVEKSLQENQCLNSHPQCPSEVCYTPCPCRCFIPSSVSPCLCSAATCSC